MQLSQLVCQALQSGYISSELEAEIGRICDPDLDLSAEEEFYLDRIMGAMLTGEVVGLYLSDAIAHSAAPHANEQSSRYAIAS